MGFFTQGEILSPVWMKLRARLEERCAATQRKLEGNLGLDDTNRLRGRILELRALLALDKDDPEFLDG